MAKDYCYACGNDYYWNWEEAFDKFGFMDGDGNVNTVEVEQVLKDAGYEISSTQWGLHNLIITSIRMHGKELMPEDSDEYCIGYDDPRDYLPYEIIELLDKELGND